jgi:hypothetical protein
MYIADAKMVQKIDGKVSDNKDKKALLAALVNSFFFSRTAGKGVSLGKDRPCRK